MGSVSYAEEAGTWLPRPYDRFMYESGPCPADSPDDEDDARDDPDCTARTAAEDGRDRQVKLYGEALSALFGRLQDTYQISESRLAAIIGISTPMMAQLASGERAKISNPAVLRRLQRLDELGSTPGVQAGDPARLLAVLSEVAVAAAPLRTTRERVGRLISSREAAAVYLGDIAVGGDLRRAAAAVPSTDLAALLLEAAHRLR